MNNLIDSTFQFFNSPSSSSASSVCGDDDDDDDNNANGSNEHVIDNRIFILDCCKIVILFLRIASNE